MRTSATRTPTLEIKGSRLAFTIPAMCSIRGMDPMLAALLVQAHSTPPPPIPSRATTAASYCFFFMHRQVEVFAILKLQPHPSMVANGMDDPTLRKQTCVRVLICRLETAFNSNLT
ncbi:uncharacterized protein FSUBG_707 [Fusarium subglutinans]|uniref:Uncharacterized protein n=1 Tax=Gibberella subglutinans TaxID=42677 RepID=A0A8H5QF69_GIBSU|nr:uncharacterized protein FSUBG_707 [Fusarium subglutinans]KAF5613498.1 hypothetical protein FSUBG_707 [Fusarium subglutinans]